MPSDVQRSRAGAATDASIRELGGVSTPDDLRREVSVDGTVILATTGTSDDAALVPQLAVEHGWPLARVDTVDAAAWAANIQKISLVIAAGDDPAFALDIVTAIRRATTAPTMTLGLDDPHDRVRTMVEGADVALPPGMAFAEFGAQVFALLRRSSETWEPAIRQYVELNEKSELVGCRAILLEGWRHGLLQHDYVHGRAAEDDGSRFIAASNRRCACDPRR